MAAEQGKPARIAFIGLGRMGRGMALNLCRKGFALAVHDLNPEPVRDLVAAGARAADGIADAVRGAQVVITMLPNSAVVLEVMTGAGGVLAHAGPGTLVMDMSTVAPEVTDQVAQAAARQDLAFVDAPVGRLASHADRGESLFMVGGAERDFARVKPVLEAMGTAIYHCGPAGSGTRTKLVNNYLAIVSCHLNAEALTLAQKFGLSLERTLDVIHGTTATNGQLKIAWATKVFQGDIEPGFTIDLAHKDLTLIVEAANAVRTPVPAAAAAREAYSTARARGWGGKDFSAMADVWCELAGAPKARLGQ